MVKGSMRALEVACLLWGGLVSFAADGDEAKVLWTGKDDAADAVEVTCDAGVERKLEDGKTVVEVAAGEAKWPGLFIRPRDGGVWDLSHWGTVQLAMTNPGTKPLTVRLRADNSGDWRKGPWNTEGAVLKPGETRLLKVAFGYQWGFKPGYPLDPSKVSAVRVFLAGKGDDPRRLVLGELRAAGRRGEKPAADPSNAYVKPKDGVLADAPFTVAVDRRGAEVPIRPKTKGWNLGDWLKVSAVVRNTGTNSVTPRLFVSSKGGRATARGVKAIAPGEQAKVEASFLPLKPWHVKGDAKDVKPSGGTKFTSQWVGAVTFGAVEETGRYEVLSVRAEDIVADVPDWVGTRPPVEGNWHQTLKEEFNDGQLNKTIWTTYAGNPWDKRTHFTTNNLHFADGKAILRYEKKTGPINDDPTKGTTDYASVLLSTFDHWTQRYGYFEARMKLPRAAGVWPAFWMMPDRGRNVKDRKSTYGDGMEFDIMEHQTSWGPHRFNIACHWDGYGKDHRIMVTSGIYLPADKEGFITVGLLWLPGVFAIYGNGAELGRWESDRVSSAPSHLYFYLVSGGWANAPLDDSQLPADFVVDWCRVWQRDDLK